MNDQMNETDDTNDNDEPEAGAPVGRRPLGYWLRAVDALLTAEFAAAFRDEGVTRRDWMLLSILAGEVDAPGAADRLARKGKRLRRLEDLGWAEERGDGTWALTEAGREAHARLGETVAGIRARVSGAVSDEDLATTMASLEAIARELGWDESRPAGGRAFGRGWGGRFGAPRAFGPEVRARFGEGFGPGFRPGFRPGPGFGPGHGMSRGEAWAYGADEDECRHGARGFHGAHAHGEHGHHPHDAHGHGAHGHGTHGHGAHGHRGHGRQRAYERGFDAGYRRGRESGAA